MRPGSLLRDERGIIVSFLLKLVLGLAVAGLVVIETSSVIVTRVQADDLATNAATDAARAYRDNGTVQAAEAAATTTVAEQGSAARVRSVQVRRDGSVEVVVSKRARTLLIHRIGFLQGFTVARATAVGRAPLL